MGTLILEEILSEVRFDLKNRPDTTSSGLSDTRLTLLVNSAYLHLCHPSVFKHPALQHRFTITLASGTNAYTFSPVGGVTITALRWGSYLDGTTETATVQRTRLVPLDEQEFERRTLNSGGPPRHYCVRNHTTLAVSPVPGTNEASNLLLFGAWREPTLLVAGAATVLPTAWDEILILAARWRTELHLGYRDLAEATKFDFTSLINEYAEANDIHSREDYEWAVPLRVEAAQETA